MNGDAMITGGNITVQKDYNNNGGNITADGDITFSLDTVSNNATSPVAMVVSNNSGSLKLMDMSNMGSHWSSDASGNPYVENKRVGIGNNNPKNDLHIGSNSNLANDYGTTLLISGQGSTPESISTSRIYFENTSSTNNKVLGIAYGGTTFRFGTLTNNGSSWNSNGKILDLDANSKLVKAYSDLEVGGNIGVGISSPQFPLQVKSTSSERGAYIDLDGLSSSSFKIGITGIVQNASGIGENVGGAFNTLYNSGGTSIALEGYAYDNSGIQYGVRALADAGSSNVSENYALYANASGGTNNWAGYFASGNVKIENNIELDGELNTSSGGSSNLSLIHI